MPRNLVKIFEDDEGNMGFAVANTSGVDRFKIIAILELAKAQIIGEIRSSGALDACFGGDDIG